MEINNQQTENQKIEEIEEAKENPEKFLKLSNGDNFQLSEANCLNYLFNLIFSRLNCALSLKDSELVYRAIRYLRNQNQMMLELDNNLDKKTAYGLLFSAVNIGHNKGLLNIEEDSVVYYCIEILSQTIKN